MADIKKIKVLGDVYNVADATARAGLESKQDTLTAGNNITIDSNSEISALKYYKQSDVTGVAGTSTTQLSSTYNVADDSVTAYYDGMLVTFVLPVAGVSTYGSVFQFNSLGYHPIVYGTNSIVGTRYPVGGQVTMIYNSVQTASAYLTKNTKTTITGCWQVCDYDTSTTDARKVFDYYFRPYAAETIYRYKLCAVDKDNRLHPITLTNQESATQVAKTPTAAALKPSDLWFYTSTSTGATNKVIGSGTLATTYYGDNMCQYNFNTSCPTYRMIYLRGTYDSTTGLFTLYNDGSSPCTSYYTYVPNNTANLVLSTYFVAGYYYWLVGSTYSTADYISVFGYNPLYYFDGTNLIPCSDYLSSNKITEPATEGTNGQVLTTDGAGGRSWTTVSGGESNVFKAVYGTTTYAQVQAAISAGKIVKVTGSTYVNPGAIQHSFSADYINTNWQHNFSGYDIIGGSSSTAVPVSIALSSSDTWSFTDSSYGTAVSGTNDGTNWTTITIAGTTKNIPGGALVDLSEYSEGSTIPTSLITTLRTYNVTVKYNNDYYKLATDTTVSGTQMVLFTALNSDAGGSGVYVYLPSGTTDWKFSGRIVIEILGYNAEGILNIKVENTDKCFRLRDGSEYTTIKKNAAQNDDIILTLPASTGNLALTSDINSANIIAGLGYTPYNSTNPAGYISGITGQDVERALGYVPYSAENPSGYISDYMVTHQDVTSALGYTPYNASNPDHYITGITGTDVTTALGYTPYSSSNPSGYITGISSSDVTTALGYTPYNSTNPNNYVNATTTALNNYYTKTAVDGMVANRFQAKIVQTLPTSGISTSTIYMVLQAGSADVYDEYMYIENAWVKIGTTSVDMSDYAKKDELHNVALTGAYSSLVGRPTIPENTSDLSNDSGFIDNTVNNLTNYTKSSDLAAVATSGSYNDLSNRPTVPTSVSQLTNDSGYLTNANLATTNISTFVNNVPYATLNDVRGLEDIDVEEIKKAIAAMEHIGTVTQVTGGTGLSGSGNTTVTINHANSITANNAWPTGTSTPENGGKFKVRDVKYDATGHINGYQDREITLPLIPIYNDTEVRGLISDEAAARTLTDGRVTSLENFNRDTFTSFVFCIFGIEPYIDPTTMQIVPDRYYQRSDVDTGIYMDNHKIDIHLKAWLKYHYGIDSLDYLKNITVYVYAQGDHGVYVNHMVTFWSQQTNPSITSYPHLQQVGSFIDDGYGSVRRFTATEIGAILSSTDDGYVQADPLGTGKGFVSGWNTLTGRVTTLEDTIGDINTVLDRINGEVI